MLYQPLLDAISTTLTALQTIIATWKIILKNGGKMEKKLVSALDTFGILRTILYKLSLLKELGFVTV